MSDDLVKRLRQAAVVIERMRAEIERLRKALLQPDTLIDYQANEIERLRADNKRLTDKLMKIAEKETYT